MPKKHTEERLEDAVVGCLTAAVTGKIKVDDASSFVARAKQEEKE